MSHEPTLADASLEELLVAVADRIRAQVLADLETRDIFTTAEAAAKYVRIGKARLLEETRAGHIVARPHGRGWRWTRHALDDWIAAGAPSRS